MPTTEFQCPVHHQTKRFSETDTTLNAVHGEACSLYPTSAISFTGYIAESFDEIPPESHMQYLQSFNTC